MVIEFVFTATSIMSNNAVRRADRGAYVGLQTTMSCVGRAGGPLELEAVAAAVAALEVLRRADDLEPPVDHDADAVGERVGLLHVVRREEDAAAAPPKCRALMYNFLRADR